MYETLEKRHIMSTHRARSNSVVLEVPSEPSHALCELCPHRNAWPTCIFWANLTPFSPWPTSLADGMASGGSTRTARVGTRTTTCREMLWYKKLHAGPYAYHRFYFIGSQWRIDPLDIGGSMGTVPRQKSVPNGPMRHRELLKWHF